MNRREALKLTLTAAGTTVLTKASEHPRRAIIYAMEEVEDDVFNYETGKWGRGLRCQGGPHLVGKVVETKHGTYRLIRCCNHDDLQLIPGGPHFNYRLNKFAAEPCGGKPELKGELIDSILEPS